MEETFKLMQESELDAVTADQGRDPNFFVREYRASSIAIMFVWFGLSIFMPIWYSASRPKWNDDWYRN